MLLLILYIYKYILLQEKHNNTNLTQALKPREVVDELNKYIVGQAEAKKAVAIALRNRWRRHQLSNDIKNEVRLQFVIYIYIYIIYL